MVTYGTRMVLVRMVALCMLNWLGCAHVEVPPQCGDLVPLQERPSVYEPFGAFETIDPWYTGLPGEIDAELTLAPEIEDVWEVSKSRFPEAEELLRERPIVRYPYDSLDAFLGVKNVSCPAKHQLYLVRAVYLSAETGGFGAVLKNRVLWISHGCLGNIPEPMNRTALVIALPEEPCRVYVSCSMDE